MKHVTYFQNSVIFPRKRAASLVHNYKLHDMKNQDLLIDSINVKRALSFLNERKQKWADELIIASRELAFQKEESEKRIAELIIVNS